LNVANSLYGVDLNQKVIDKLKTEYKVPNLYVDDVEKLKIKPNDDIDIIIAGELIEHLHNPGLFLESVKRYMKEDTVFILTTPNIIALKVFLHSIFNKQRIHPDHTLGFTYSLLETLFERHGLQVAEWYTCVEIFNSKKNKIANSIFNNFFDFFPRYADTIICNIKLK
jgi:SAM-dependent methyltransferase